jgi:diacylglycerol kinase family enzyme
MTENKADFDYHFTKDMDHALQLSRNANQEGYKTIVAVGGDGTINAVVNGFYNNEGQRISDAKFGVIYTGTSPDFNRSYNIPLTVDQAVDSIIKQKIREIPVGMITFEAANGSESPGVRYFVCCTNIGLGAALARKANSGIRRKLGDFWGTFLSLIGLLFRFRTFSATSLENDGKTMLSKLTNISIGITPYIASGIRVPLNFAFGEKQFYKMTVSNLNLLRIVPLLKKVYSGKPFKNSEYLFLDSTTQIELSSANAVEVEADGDPVGMLPCAIRFAKHNLPLIVSENL